MVEAAIITPLLLLLTMGLMEFASLLYVFLSLQNGASQATRFAVTGNAVAGQSREQSIMTAFRQATPTLTLQDQAFAFSHMPPGGTSWAGGTGGPGDVGKVTVNYTWTFFTPLMRPFFPSGQITLSVESAMKNEALWTQ
jgi:Flp pilus assembly protein TadG